MGDRPARWRTWQSLLFILTVWLAWAIGTYIIGVVVLRAAWLLIPVVVFSGLAVGTLGFLIHAAVTRRLSTPWGTPASHAISLGAYCRGYFATLLNHYRTVGSFLTRRLPGLLVERSRQWYRGRYIPPPPYDPSSPIVVISSGHYEQPTLAKCLGAIGRFWLAHWQWIIGTALAIVGLLLALRQKP